MKFKKLHVYLVGVLIILSVSFAVFYFVADELGLIEQEVKTEAFEYPKEDK